MSYLGVGVMSGSSTDGLDVCCAEFTGSDDNDVWNHRIVKSQVFPYNKEWKHRLQNAASGSAMDIAKLHVDFGHFIGKIVKEFVEENHLAAIQFVASHGHTVFHQPDQQFTFQIGDGETIASYVNAVVVTNFRNKDVALGGQGAPMVPIGEHHLFGEHNIFLNFGGVCNITVDGKGFDVCPCNVILNYLSQKHDPKLQYDPNGETCRAGSIIPDVLEELRAPSYFKTRAPKSLGREWVEENMIPIFEEGLSKYPPRDMMRTAVEMITEEICDAILQYAEADSSAPIRVENTMLITGGGALNVFLVETLKQKIEEKKLLVTIVESDTEMIKCKEALIFAFLGLRCLLSLTNVLQEVTGADRDSVCGSIHLPPGGVPVNLLTTDQYSFSIRRRSSTAGSQSLSVPGNGNKALVSEEPLRPATHASWPGQPNRKYSSPT